MEARGAVDEPNNGRPCSSAPFSGAPLAQMRDEFRPTLNEHRATLSLSLSCLNSRFPASQLCAARQLGWIKDKNWTRAQVDSSFNRSKQMSPTPATRIGAVSSILGALIRKFIHSSGTWWLSARLRRTQLDARVRIQLLYRDNLAQQFPPSV